jgi:hypothetical protein
MVSIPAIFKYLHRQYARVKWEGPDLIAKDIGIVGLEVPMAVTVMCHIFLNETPYSQVLWKEPAVSIFRA